MNTKHFYPFYILLIYVIKLFQYCQAVVPLIPDSGGRGWKIFVSLKTAWSTELAPGRIPKLYRKALS